MQILAIIVAFAIIVVAIGVEEVFAEYYEDSGAGVAWDKAFYEICDTGTITIYAEEENTNPNLIQTFFIQVTSDSDYTGVEVVMVETGNNSGIFVGALQLCEMLSVSEGDRVYAHYGKVVGAVDIISSYSQSPSPITLKTDKLSYEFGDTIKISGEVTLLTSSHPVTIIVTGPTGKTVTAKSVDVVGNSYALRLTKTDGSSWQESGTYIIKAIHGTGDRTAKTSFFFSGSTGTGPGPGPSGRTIDVGGLPVSYQITGGTLNAIQEDFGAKSLIISITATDDGNLTIILPRNVIDATFNGGDDEFFVLIDGVQVDFDETKTSPDRTLTIYFPYRASEIEIIGTSVIGNSYSPPVYQAPTTKTNPPSPISTSQVKTIAGSGTPGCEETFSCYSPYSISVRTGTTVTWTNADKAAHTVTSGNPSTGPDGTFDSSMFMASDTFSHEFSQAGEFPYFCMVHPWMVGTVIVEGFTSGGWGFITQDTIPPKILQPKDIVADAEDGSGIRVNYDVLAIDDVDQIVTPSCSPSSGSFFSVGDTEVVCSAFDSAGNAASKKTFLVTVNPSALSIPVWIKDVAVFWCDEKIDDSSFIEGIQYLIDNDIIIITGTSVGSGGQEIPSWIKNNACWWSYGFISDVDFAQGLQYLVQEGIIQV